MKIKTLHLGLIKTNCYLISTEKAAVVIDPGFDRPGTLEFFNENPDKERLILLTHAHFDHIGGAEVLREKTGVKIGIGQPDAEGLLDTKLNLSDMFHAHISPFKPDFTYENGDKILVGDIEFKVISTPGHTVGGVSYLTEDKLFSGDTLFENSIGRTDFPGGDLKVLQRSVKKLLTLPPDTKVYPGHGDPTTVAREKEYNMFVR
ncbi:MAG: MBL fold metallo-hydrolase [Acutalibacteraceae bacterium]|nr:MBL fold metallo-hydrolase [Acutalibacteraceae bacterium]